MTRGRLRPTWLILGFVTLVACLLLSQAAAQPGKSAIVIPERNDAGDWYGTWYYVSSERLMAIYIREQEGLPELKFQFASKAHPEAFESDWGGRASYLVSGKPATFAMTISERDENLIKGRWNWESPRGSLRWVEKSNFTLYRTGTGRRMVLKFEDLERIVYRSEEDVRRRHREEAALTFLKASRRVVLWEELPF